MKEDAFWIREQVKAHNKWFEESLPMIASENVMSPLAKEMMVSDFHDRYAEGLPGKRYYMGNIYVDRVELKCLELARKIFDCQFADVRPTSGTVANIAVLFALIKPGDLVSCSALAQGAHISTAKFGAFGIRGVRSINYPFNEDDMNIDIDGTRKVLLEHRPKVCQFGLSVFLFPTPLRELEDTFHEIDATVWYDAAHVLGLIAGKRFQDPFREGCDVISASTHKTFPGPNHGILLAHNIDDELEKNLQRAAFPGVTSSHHLHAMAALAITLAEQEVFAEQYADQVIRNAKALGEALFELGMGVLCPHKGFTESHTIAVDVSEHGGGVIASSDLEESNIITNKNLLPGDMSAVKPSGIRLGSQELTRVGMKESEMKEVADFIYRVVAKKENPKLVREDVKALKKDFTTVKYCFTEGGAYDYHDFV